MGKSLLKNAQQAFEQEDFTGTQLKAAGGILTLLETHFNNGPNAPDEEANREIPPSAASLAWLGNALLDRVIDEQQRASLNNVLVDARGTPDAPVVASPEDAKRAISAAQTLLDRIAQRGNP